MYGVVTADIVIPAITVTAIAIVFAIMAYLDKREAEAKARRNWVMAKRYRNAYRLVLDKLEAYEGEANLRYDSQQTGQVANKNESENLADRYSSGYLHGNPALSRNVSNTHDGKQVGPRGQGVRRVPEVAAGAGPTPRTEWPRSKHDV